MSSKQATRPSNQLPSALEEIDEIVAAIGSRDPAVFLDYDGTLAPIVRHPDLARLADGMREVLEPLSRRWPMAVISGRPLEDVRGRIGIDQMVYAGDHGFEIAGPGLPDQARELDPTIRQALEEATEELDRRLEGVPGAWVETKRFSAAVHHREVVPGDEPHVLALVDEVAGRYPELRLTQGRKTLELQPDVDWDKGRAIEQVADLLDLDPDQTLPVYIGDDVTDEDAFQALSSWGLGVLVGQDDRPTAAGYTLSNPAEVRRFLEALDARL